MGHTGWITSMAAGRHYVATALPIPSNPNPLDDSISARWLYGSVRAAAHDKRKRGGHAARGEVDGEGEGGQSASMFYGNSFVSTSRDGQALLWALPPLLRRRAAGGNTAQAPTWELHPGDDKCGDEGEHSTGSAHCGAWSTPAPAWEFRALVQLSSRGPPPLDSTPGGTPAGCTGTHDSRNSIHDGPDGTHGGAEGRGLTGASAAAAAAAAPEAVPHSQAASMPHPPLSGASTAGVSRSRGGAASKHQGQGGNTVNTDSAGTPLLPPTLPASPLLELSSRSAAILTSDVWLPCKGSMQEEWARKEGLVGLLATGAADGTVKVGCMCT
ncbi:hypothetical protein DUNSADRAFT_7306 [Dunaliella salina]|uniref:Uncharacterized protein n=1 Tax=Dunaliella salina TaxID=3046 RepID=A0ABQ7FTD8_DUNSA|nr:hypothetical protein DUNSADRAFT_7306 [Dunaliella salina]|eukprot:KAF5825724.1 hypothetical protein DUNSADRAFT_7306 [Dunaliella salina]